MVKHPVFEHSPSKNTFSKTSSTKNTIDRPHRIERYDKTKKKPRPIIVKFVRYNVRGRVFREKRKLKGTGKTITESLTTKRIGQLNDAREKFGFHNVWSYDGKILYKINNEVKVYYD